MLKKNKKQEFWKEFSNLFKNIPNKGHNEFWARLLKNIKCNTF